MKAMRFDEYERLAAGGGPVPVFREMPGDLHTPVSAYQALSARSERAFLLESVVGGERLARYSFLGRDPEASFEIAPRPFAPGAARPPGESLLPILRAQLGPRAAEVEGLPRFTGGAVGYVTYDAVRHFERIPDRRGPGDEPLAIFSLYRSVVAFDHARQRLLVIADAPPGGRADFDRAQAVLDALEADLRGDPAPWRSLPRAAGPSDPPATAFGDGAAFRDAVLKAKEHIAAGDIFQVVLSRQATLPCPARPLHGLPRAADGEPVAVHVLPQGRATARGGRRLAGDAGAGGGAACRDAPHRRHAAPRGGTPRRTRPWPRSSWPTRRSAPSTSCSWTWAATTWAACAGSGRVTVPRAHEGRALLPRHAPREQRDRRAAPRAGRPRRAAWPRSRRAPSRARRRSGPWRSSTSWSRSAAASTAAPSATSTCAATWTSASPSAPSSSKGGAPRPGGGRHRRRLGPGERE